MNKRLLYRNKIVRLYEEDIWGIFFRKQKKRDLFFKKIGYQLFLEIFRKNTRAVKPTIFAWKKKIFNTASKYTYNKILQQKTVLLFFKSNLSYYLTSINTKQQLFTRVQNKNNFLYLKKRHTFSNDIAAVLC